jgi:hypothetical protein
MYVSKLEITGMHLSLAKQDKSMANVYLAILPVNKVPWFAFPLKSKGALYDPDGSSPSPSETSQLL